VPLLVQLLYKLTCLSRQEIEAMFTLSDLKQTRFYQEAFEEGREEGIQQGVQQGRQEGRQEGKQEGRQEGKLELIPFMLGLGVTLEQIAEALNLPLEKVQAFAQSNSQET
jgi:predicted transposase/invertase (TIGR01784 family)